MPQPVAAAAAPSADCNDDSQPIFPLTQYVLAPFSSPPPLLASENSVKVDVHTDLFSHEEDAFACSDRMLTVEVIIINDSSTRSAGDAGWEQYFGQKIKYKGKGVRA
jgi:hypothetical protein